MGAMTGNDEAARKHDRLVALLRDDLADVVVAYSGGCDSAFLLKVAHDTLGGARVLGLTAVGASLAPGERDKARELALLIGARHREVESREIDNPLYAANPTNRCYHCKTELYDLAVAEARRLGARHVLSGTNADELGDYRPGLKAAAEHGVRHPLAEVGLTKEEIRSLSREFGLPTWDKPQTPCLASRLPYGTPVTPERLAQVDRAEEAVRRAGLKVFRVRHHESIARLEVAEAEHSKLSDPATRAAVNGALLAAGYAFAVVDLEPFRSGRLNEAAGLVPLGGRRSEATARPA
ncbi:MAG: hypothetical protein RL199_1278 [Pseudomonadota bacterium]|jgi:uncharacterized protein